MNQSNFESLDLSLLTTVAGGQAAPQRTWSQVGREYTAACLQGARQALVSGGMPRDVREGATSAAIGCASAVGMKAVDDVSAALTGR